jgi:glycosyltransferase involved in cell wall biosynthesis
MRSERPVHVGIDATTWANDRGFGRFTRELLKALAARNTGFRYTLLFDQPPSDDTVPVGVESICAATRGSLNEASMGTNSRSLAYLWRLGRAARQAKFDVFFFPAVYSYYPVLARVPCVVCYHDTTAERFPHLLFPSALNHRLWQAKTLLAGLQTTRAMTVSQASAKDLERILRFPKHRIDVVTEAADPAFRILDDPEHARRTKARHRIPSEHDLLVYVGGMNRHKNILGLLEAMPTVIAARPNTHLAIVGDTSGSGFWDNVPELRQFIDAHPRLASHVTFTNRIADDELVELLNGAAALVFPSLWEGFGLPAVEAMACGVPVLSSDRGSLPEVVGDAGLFFDPEDRSAIANCVVRFLADDTLRRNLAKAAVARAGLFTWERAAELAEDSFRRCTAVAGVKARP